MLIDFFDISYLSRGSAIQRKGYDAITSSGILDSLKEFNPVVAGTLPLDLFTAKSDIDIICEFKDGEQLVDTLVDVLDPITTHFHIDRKALSGIDSVVANFEYEGFQFEIVGQPIDVKEQLAYRHMVVEWHILAANDDAFRKRILALKNQGVKTEPAFAQILGLTGNPYAALLHYLQ